MWAESAAEFGWDTDVDRYVIHQVSNVHTRALSKVLDLDLDRIPLTFPTRGNLGPAAIPFTLASIADDLSAGDRVLLMGIGSGLNAPSPKSTGDPDPAVGRRGCARECAA